jgi:hypothetical protein
MELTIKKNEKGELVAVLPEDLAQLPTLFKSFLDRAALAEPSVKLAELQTENEKLKVKVAELSGPDYLKARLANLNEETYVQLGRELGFLEVEDAAKGENLAENGKQPETGKAPNSAHSSRETATKPHGGRTLNILK